MNNWGVSGRDGVSATVCWIGGVDAGSEGVCGLANMVKALIQGIPPACLYATATGDREI